MLTRPWLHVHWYLSTPLILATVLILAIGANRLAGVYFQRSFVDEVDPFAGLSDAQSTRLAAPIQPVAAGVRQSGAEPISAAVPPVAEAVPTPSAGPVLLAEGTFVDGEPGHRGRGTARVIRGADGTDILRLEDFSVTNGPDLFVILSTDPTGSRGSAAAQDALNLGRLRATDGNVNYSVPPGTGLSVYRSAIIYCRAFRTVFAVATLEQR